MNKSSKILGMQTCHLKCFIKEIKYINSLKTMGNYIQEDTVSSIPNFCLKD